MRALLIALLLSMTACATIDTPEVSRTLRDYNPPELAPAKEPLPLPTFEIAGEATVDGQTVVYLTLDNFAALEQYQIAAKGNTKALQHRTEAWNALLRERNHILAAGQAAEGQAAIFRQLYQNEANYCRIVQWVSIGGVGLIAIAAVL